MTDPLPIGPQTKVGELLDAYPELEEVLIAQAPAFAKLKNPVLRRTVARLATLEAASGLAGLRVRDLVITLRRAAGQVDDEVDMGSTSVVPATTAGELPEWLEGCSVRQTLAAEELLEAGQTPLSAVVQAAHQLASGEALQLEVSFVPEPLIEAVHKQGFRTHLQQGQEGSYQLFVANV